MSPAETGGAQLDRSTAACSVRNVPNSRSSFSPVVKITGRSAVEMVERPIVERRYGSDAAEDLCTPSIQAGGILSRTVDESVDGARLRRRNRGSAKAPLE